jgi:hypothetical protein
MNIGAAFVAYGEPSKAMEPRDGALDDPATGAQAAALRGAASHKDGDNAPSAQAVASGCESYPRSPCRADGFRRGRPRRPRIGGRASTSGSRCVMSLTLAAVTCATSGMLRRSVMRCCLEPALRHRLGSVQFFPPSQRAERAAIDDRPAQVEPTTAAEVGEQHFMQPLPDAGALPRDCPIRSPFHAAEGATATPPAARREFPSGPHDPRRSVDPCAGPAAAAASAATIRCVAGGDRRGAVETWPTVPSRRSKYKGPLRTLEMRS